MWTVENETPYAADAAFQSDSEGAKVWVVVVKATYDIHADGSLELARVQVPVARAPRYLGEPGKTGLLHESDFVPTKPTTDVVLHGHAYAPGGEPVTELVASLTVGPVHKVLRVVGDRTWVKSLASIETTEPQRFVQMPLTNDRAHGGVDENGNGRGAPSFEPRNPIGTGYAARRAHLEGQRAPNVLHNLDATTPAGVGPIARDWEPRLSLAGTYDEAWQRTRHPLVPLDFDERFYQCAPVDQQAPSYLQGGERVALYNLTPESSLSFELPRVQLAFRTDFGDELVEHRAVLHTVVLEPDIPRLQMVWHTGLKCHHRSLELRRTLICEEDAPGRRG